MFLLNLKHHGSTFMMRYQTFKCTHILASKFVEVVLEASSKCHLTVNKSTYKTTVTESITGEFLSTLTWARH